MDYPYENLSPEKFQEFCQSLLVREFPDVQCFPVAQPDGGRDAVSFRMTERIRKFYMFQVKFVRNPHQEQDPHRWLYEVLVNEIPKVMSQIPKGASQFVLISNVKGTAHPDSGSIDKVDLLLKEALHVPSICWWRDDLNRRLDNAYDLKWVYPELMTGPDLIRSIVETGLGEHKERRQSAIKAFVKDQYLIDQEVKFKQVELQNKLLDLYIDVPITLPQATGSKRAHYLHNSIYNSILHNLKTQKAAESLETFFEADDSSKIGAATFFLQPLVQKTISRVVLEGAPGQGKSTITQYLCQLHRMRILQKDEELKSVSDDHRRFPVRLPVRIDLRDLAVWLSKKDPFSLDSIDEIPSNWSKSLESFLAALIHHHSGGMEFEIADLLAIAKVTSFLLVFDGLDEVADIAKRQEVVDEIYKGINRLEENSASLQVIVTSRPAAFANSPGLPEEGFPYFQLGSVTRALIDEYAEKWLRARKLHGRESADVRKILKNKLNLPHLRDLARNPMQLAILLSLIHRRGSSLPDKRTALYDSYMGLFFDRESEKSTIVRDHRGVLIDIHRYLAWILHTQAETGNNSGSISEDNLHQLLTDYLRAEGHDEALAEILFSGMVERVVALVSRVQGTYEFEVQPLREYFAARFLYETAPYSPTGNEKKGTKPERFDAIARNSYWSNVTRFYAGCYSSGELASLIESIKELLTEEGYRLVSHPRVLAAILLSDWVFTQRPKSVQEVIKLILDGIGLRNLLTSNSRRFFSTTPLVLPKKCGNEELIDFCFDKLKEDIPKDFAFDVIDLISANSNANEIGDIWFNITMEQSTEKRIKWIEYGQYLGTLSRVPLPRIALLTSGFMSHPEVNELLITARRLDYFEEYEERFVTGVNLLLNKDVIVNSSRRGHSLLEQLVAALDVRRYAVAFNVQQPVPLSSIWESGRVGFNSILKTDLLTLSLLPFNTNGYYEIIKAAEIASQAHARAWSTELAPWELIVETIRSFVGENWACYHLANVASGINSLTETCRDFPNLLDKHVSLCKRTRYARLRAGVPMWWDKQFGQANNTTDKILILYILLTWCGTNVIFHMLQKIDEIVASLDNLEWNKLFRLLEQAVEATTDQAKNRFFDYDISSMPKKLDPRTVTLLSLRAKPHAKEKLYNQYLASYSADDQIVLEYCQTVAIDSLLRHKDPKSLDWSLDVIARSYQAGIVAKRYAYHKVIRRVHRYNTLSEAIAERIARNPQSYPSFLVALAESKIQSEVASRIVPVGEIAKQQNWFTDDV